jgi:hypothetical protein
MAQYFIYPDTQEPFTGRPVPYHRQDANTHFLTHYGNAKYLAFFLANTCDFGERRQLAKEMEVCDRKLASWRRHINFEPAVVARETQVIDATWASGKRYTPDNGKGSAQHGKKD